MRPEASERFLVTGALGCIGAWTVRALVKEGVPVVAFDLGNDPRRLRQVMTPDELSRVSFVPGDITDLEGLNATLDRYDITNVIHLAALQVPFARADPPLGARVNVVGTVNVFEAVKRRGEATAILSNGSKPCTVGWNLKPLTPCSSISLRASRAPILPLCGSMLPNAIMTSLLAWAASAIYSLGMRRRPSWVSASTVNITNPIFFSR